MRVLSFITAILALVVFACDRASAHDWYPLECCSQKDCAPVAPGSVKRTPQGWRLPSGHVLPYDDARVKPLPPGRTGVHVCETQDAARRPLCLFIGEAQL